MPDAGDSNASGRLTRQMLPVGDGHEIYVETVGNAEGIPAVYLHGGPGSGCQPDHRRLFDQRRVHAVLFDQRGAGLSRPKKGSRTPTQRRTWSPDMEKIREKLGFERWLVVGGSWGATLALAYAEQHPQRVLGLVLRATFLGTRAELEWAFLGGLRTLYPALNDDFLSLLPPEERAQPLDAYWRRILDPDPAVHTSAARAWHDTERILSGTQARPHPARSRCDPNQHAPAALDAVHGGALLQNQCFFTPRATAGAGRQVAWHSRHHRAGALRPAVPAINVPRAARRGPEAELRIVETAGHSLYDPGITDAVTTAIADLIGAK